MHLAEGILPTVQMLSTTLVAVPLVFLSAYKLRQQFFLQNAEPANRSFLTMAFTLSFAVTLLPIPIPIAGASSHMCATPLLTYILGPVIVPALTAAVLLIQALFFAHGGLTTLGANTLTLGIVGPAVTLATLGVFAAFRVSGKLRLFFAFFLGSLAVYLGDSLLLAWSYADKQPFLKTFGSVCLGFLPVQGPLSMFEALISTKVVTYLSKSHLFSDLQRPTWCQMRHVAPTVILFLIIVSSGTVFFSSRILASTYEGLDEVLFVKTAESFGVYAKDLNPWMTGEVELTIFSLGFFVAGLISGLAYNKWQTFSQQRGLQSNAF